MFRKAHRFLTGLTLPAVTGALACGAFGTSSVPDDRPPAAAPALDASAPPNDANEPPADARPDASPQAPRFLGTAAASTLPAARAYARSADARTFALLDRGQSDAVAVVDPAGLLGKRWRSEAPGVSLAMLTTTSTESEVQDGLAAVIIEDNSTRRMRIGNGHNERGLKGNTVASAGSLVFVASDAAITQAEVDGRLDVVDNTARAVLTQGERAPFAVSTNGQVLLRRDPGVDAVYVHSRPSTQATFGPPARTTYAPSVEDLQLMAVGAGGDTFVAAGRCAPGLPAKCLWTFTLR